MSDSDTQEQFDQGSSGASDCFPMQCSALRKGGVVCIKDRPCKIVDMSTSKTGKHGHAKVHLVAIDVFTGKKLEDLCPSTHNMMVPTLTRVEYTILDVAEDDFVTLMSADGTTKSDLKVPEGEVGEALKAMYESGKEIVATVLSAMGQEAIIQVKESNETK